MEKNHELLVNLEKLHTTARGVSRIAKNLSLDGVDVVDWCKAKIKSPRATITRHGKNWYVYVDDCVLTIHATHYTIITAHRFKQQKTT